MNFPRKIILCALGMFSGSVLATNYEDLWWQPAESGWGINITQQHDIMFATWFIYNADRTPLWFSMSRGEKVNSNTFAGPLYITSGPGFAGAFNPTEVTRTQVGNANFSFSDEKNGVLSYTVNGASITKNITRNTYRNIPINGIYSGSAVTNFMGCNIPNGKYSLNETITVSGNGNNISIKEQTATASCDSVGTYTQYGSMFQASGTYTCSDGTSGTWVSPDMRVTENSFVAKVETQTGTCRGSGVIGGIK